MFLNFFKIFSAKRKLKNHPVNINTSITNLPINSVGIVIDATQFNDVDALLREIDLHGIPLHNIQVLLYKDRFKKKEVVAYPYFSKKEVSWLGSIENKEAKDFKRQKFDMLISYYDVKKTALLLVTQKSMADFKVGFASIDKKYNHFMIDTTTENYKVFVDELFKYLKILNKL